MEPPTTVEAALTNWLADIADTRSRETHKSYHYALQTFQQWLAMQGAMPSIAALTAPLLQQYVNYLLERRLDERTLHQYVGVLVRWLQALVDAGELPGIPNQRGKLLTPVGLRSMLEQRLPRVQPAVAPRVPDLRRLPAYYDERLRIFLRQHDGCPPSVDEPMLYRTYLNLERNRALIATLFSTGGRINEVLSLDVRMVQRGRQITDVVRIVGKGRKQRPLHLNASTCNWIASYLGARHATFATAPALFISHGPRGKGERLSDVSAWKVVKEAGEALAALRQSEGASREEVRALVATSPHTLRHFLAQAMLDEGADYKDLTAVLGHSSAVVTEQFYARLGDERVMEVIETFAPQPASSFGDKHITD